MTDLSRRVYMLGCCGVAALAGCSSYPPPDDRVEFRTIERFEIQNVGERHELTIKIEVTRTGMTVKDITLLAYSMNGAEVARQPVGTLDESRRDAIVTTECTDFPAIITADAARTVCDDLNLPILYLDTASTTTEKSAWKQTVRECGNSLPPDYILKRYRTASPDGN